MEIVNPVVSVIIPAYNTAAYISRAIESALKQTLSDLEVVVVDDCSTDETVAVVQSFIDDRLILLQNPQNLGAGGARNRALQAARGKWIAVLDSDDWYAPERLEKLVAHAEANDADLLSDDLYLVEDGSITPWGTLLTESGEQISRVTQIEPEYFVNSDIEGQQGLHLGFSKPLFKREFLERYDLKYDPTIKVSQDFWLYMDCFRYQARFFFVPQPYYYYRARVGSLINSDKIQRLDDECRAISNFLKHKDFSIDNPRVFIALIAKQIATHNYRDYYKVVEPLKQGNVATALKEAANNFKGILCFFARQIPRIIDRRTKFWFKGNRLVNNKMYQGNLSKR
jgi:succinoglycan biosynthesis protein ExoO